MVSSSLIAHLYNFIIVKNVLGNIFIPDYLVIPERANFYLCHS